MTTEILAEEIKELRARMTAMEKAIAAPPPQQTGAIPREEMSKCEEAWGETLAKLGIERPVLPHEQHKIFSLLAQYGYKATLYALTGMRYERGTQSFDPRKHVAISRAFDAKLFEVFVNLAAAEMTKQKKVSA